jgi:hypothetical protein
MSIPRIGYQKLGGLTDSPSSSSVSASLVLLDRLRFKLGAGLSFGSTLGLFARFAAAGGFGTRARAAGFVGLGFAGCLTRVAFVLDPSLSPSGVSSFDEAAEPVSFLTASYVIGSFFFRGRPRDSFWGVDSAFGLASANS